MLTRCLRLMRFMCFIGLLTSCTSSIDKISQLSDEIDKPKPLYPTSETRAVPDFTQVYIEGPFHVRLHTHKNKPASLKIDGDAIDLQYILSHVKNGVLYVSDDAKKTHIGTRRLRMGEATLEINVPELHGFTYKGEGVITAHHIRSSLLDIWLMNPKKSTFDGRINLRRLTVLGDGTTEITGIRSRNLCIKLKGSPKVDLKGRANLKRIDMEGNGALGLYWVKSKDLILRLSGTSQLTLAGTVNRLDGVFSGHSHFHGRYLRVKESFVKTNGEAISDISVVDTQHALARDRSDIYYYNLPALRTDFMARNGSVLDMRPEALKEEQPHTIYNH
jgi:hypothetical protein